MAKRKGKKPAQMLDYLPQILDNFKKRAEDERQKLKDDQVELEKLMADEMLDYLPQILDNFKNRAEDERQKLKDDQVELEKLTADVAAIQKEKYERSHSRLRTARQQREEFNAQWDRSTHSVVRKTFLLKYDFSKFSDLHDLFFELTTSEIYFLFRHNESFVTKVKELDQFASVAIQIRWLLERLPASFRAEDIARLQELAATILDK